MPDQPQPAHPGAGIQVAVDPRDLPDHAMRADEVVALLAKEIA